MADTAATRNRLLGVLVALMAVACILLALLLLQPASNSGQVRTNPNPAAAPATTAPAQPVQPGQAQQPAQPQQQRQQVSFNDQGYGQLGDRARHAEGDPLAIGRADAPVVLVEYADFACPFCAVWAQEGQRRLISQYVDNGTLRIEWRDLVIFGEKSQHAALAGRAAAAQGRFWQFHDALFAASPRSGHPDLTDEALTAFAKQAGVPDMERFARDMKDPKNIAAVDRDTAEARSFGAQSTPTFVINGVPVVGAQPVTAFQQVIEAAKAAKTRTGA